MPKAKWEHYAAGLSIDKLKDSILTGSDAHPEAWEAADFGFLREIKQLKFESVLDFGCGLGRNILPLKRVFQNVDGYDLPAMLQRLEENDINVYDSARLLSSDWSVFKRRRYNLIVSELVFQHIFEMELIGYLEDIASMSPYLWLLTRSWNDDYHKNNIRIINDTGLFQIEYIRVSPETIIGKEPVITLDGIQETIQKLAPRDLDFHCAMLLKSKRYHKQDHLSAQEIDCEIKQPLGERELEMLEYLAHENLAREEAQAEESHPSEGVLRDNIYFANIIYDRTVSGKTESNRRRLGPIITFVKAKLKRLLGWYVEPALENQREFNACIAQAAREIVNHMDCRQEKGEESNALMQRDLAQMRDNIIIVNKYLEKLSPDFRSEIARFVESEETGLTDDSTKPSRGTSVNDDGRPSVS